MSHRDPACPAHGSSNQLIGCVCAARELRGQVRADWRAWAEHRDADPHADDELDQAIFHAACRERPPGGAA